MEPTQPTAIPTTPVTPAFVVPPVAQSTPPTLPPKKKHHWVLWVLGILFLLCLGGFFLVKMLLGIVFGFLENQKSALTQTQPKSIVSNVSNFGTAVPGMSGAVCFENFGAGLTLPARFSLLYEDEKRVLLRGASSEIYLARTEETKDVPLSIDSKTTDNLSFEGTKNSVGFLVIIDTKKVDTDTDVLKTGVTEMFNSLHSCEK